MASGVCWFLLTFTSISVYVGMRKKMSTLLMLSEILREPSPSGFVLAVADGVQGPPWKIKATYCCVSAIVCLNMCVRVLATILLLTEKALSGH